MPAQPLESRLDTRSEQFERNCSDLLEQIDEVQKLLDEAAQGGGPRAHERLAARGKLPVRERISLVLDPGSPFLEIAALAGCDSDEAVGAGLVTGIGVIAGVECVILANDPSVAGGALTDLSVKKWSRALQVARENRIPYVSFVESAGADLTRLDGENGTARPKEASLRHFAETGGTFHDITELSQLRIPTVCVVFGSSTAGGAYQPGMSDYTIFVKDRSQVFLAGPPLVKVATGEDADAETLGGALMHAEVSGLADYLAEDEVDAIRLCRQVIGHLNWRKAAPSPAVATEPPRYDSEELLGVLARDLRQPLDVREVIARVVDGSRFEEFKPRYGPTLVCGWAQVHGYPVGILGNNGVLLPESSEKGAQFIQLCNRIDVPLVFLHHITGFMVGKEYEQAGMVKKGSQLINAVSNSKVPHLAVILGASYGAGNYGMSGRGYGNRFTWLWPTAKIAVMGPKQIAGVMSIVRQGQAARRGVVFDEEADREIVSRVEAAQERGSLALAATSTISDDGIIDPRDTRDVLGMCLSVCHNAPVVGADGFGVFRL
jgi:acetyl-CoA carboxylase carboxyltransferase component